MTLTGTSGGTTTTDGSGNYSFSGLLGGGSFTVTPTKAARPPGSANINTSDVVAVQRHFLQIVLLTGCRLTAADCATPIGVNTADVIAIQRFFLGIPNSAGSNVGKYSFTPASRSYTPLTQHPDRSGITTRLSSAFVNRHAFANPRPGGPPRGGR